MVPSTDLISVGMYSGNFVLVSELAIWRIGPRSAALLKVVRSKEVHFFLPFARGASSNYICVATVVIRHVETEKTNKLCIRKSGVWGVK